MPFGFRRGGGGKGRGGRGGYGMGRRGIGRRMVPGAVGNCICPVCNTIVQHQRGIPCYQTICPNCGAQMTRQFIAPASVSSQLGTDSTQIPRIDPDICNGCGVCISTCPRGAIELVNEKAIIHPESCSNCRACIAACPVSAIN